MKSIVSQVGPQKENGTSVSAPASRPADQPHRKAKPRCAASNSVP